MSLIKKPIFWVVIFLVIVLVVGAVYLIDKSQKPVIDPKPNIPTVNFLDYYIANESLSKVSEKLSSSYTNKDRVFTCKANVSNDVEELVYRYYFHDFEKTIGASDEVWVKERTIHSLRFLPKSEITANDSLAHYLAPPLENELNTKSLKEIGVVFVDTEFKRELKDESLKWKLANEDGRFSYYFIVGRSSATSPWKILVNEMPAGNTK